MMNVVERRPSLEPQYDLHRRRLHQHEQPTTRQHQPQTRSSSSHAASSLLYDRVGPSVRLRPTAPAGFRRALHQDAHKVQELTLLGFSESAVADELYHLVVERMSTSLRTLRIVSLDLWSATHLQSTTALAVGPALGRLVVAPGLQVLHLQRVSMGRTAAHVQALATALQHHPSLQVLCMDVHSHQLNSDARLEEEEEASSSHRRVYLDPLMRALVTCTQLRTLQIYMSGYQRGRLQTCGHALQVLLTRLHELSLHMVSLPRTSAGWTQGLQPSSKSNLQVLRWTHVNPLEQAKVDWALLLRDNASLQSVSLSIPANQRAACWKAIAHHPQLSFVSLSLVPSLQQVPAFVGKSHCSTTWMDIPMETVDPMEFHFLTQALSSNPRLLQVGHASSHKPCVQALLMLNQGPRNRYLGDASRWWTFVALYAHDLDALWLLLRLHPSSVQ